MKQLKLSTLTVLISSALVSASTLADDLTPSEEVIIYGTQYTQPLTIAEPATKIIDNKEIEKKQYSNIAEVVNSVAGASIDSGARSGGERINIRGFDKPSDLGVFVDGAPIGFQQYRAGTFFFDPFLIGEAKVTKGTFDYKALNGKFGGTVRIKTKTVSDLLEKGEKFGTRVSVGYNNNDHKKSYGLSAYGKANNGLYFLANGSFKNSENINLGDGTELEYSGYEQTNSLIKVGYENQDHKIEVSNTHYEDMGRKPWALRSGKMPKIDKRKIRKYGSAEKARYAYTVANEYKDNTTTISYNYNPNNPYVNFNVVAANSKNERHWVRPDIAREKMFISIGNYGHEAWMSYERDYLDISNVAYIGDHTLTTGLQYEKTDRNSEVYNATYKKKKAKNYGHFTPYFEPSGIQSIYGVYIADEYQVADNIVITPSLKYEYIKSRGKGNAAPDYNDAKAGHDYSETIHSGLSARLAIDYNVTENTSINFSYANAIKAPTIDNIYSVQYARATATATARDLNVSRISAYQLSLINETESLIGNADVLATEITGFYNDVTNTVGARRGANLDKETDALQSWNTNLAGNKTYGVELISQYRYEKFYSDFALSLMRGKTKGSLRDSTGEDDDLARVPPMNIDLGLGYELFDGFKTGWEMNWFAAQTKTGKDLWLSLHESEAYTLQNIYATWDVKQAKGLTMGVSVNNLTNQYYKPYLANGVAGAGREVKLHASYKF